jgi:large subunit ribosomal protein L9
MKVLLVEDIDGLGKMGEVVQVKPGYGRNYLIPKKLAVLPSEGAVKDFQVRQKKLAKIHAKLVKDASQVKAELEQIPFVTIEHRANEEGVLYGSVTPSMIAEALLDYKIKVEAKLIQLKEHIKQTGDYDVDIHLYKDVTTKLKVKVVPTLEVKTEAGQSDEGTQPASEQTG